MTEDPGILRAPVRGGRGRSAMPADRRRSPSSGVAHRRQRQLV